FPRPQLLSIKAFFLLKMDTKPQIWRATSSPELLTRIQTIGGIQVLSTDFFKIFSTKYPRFQGLEFGGFHTNVI
ncbi:hypothetical protein, partial [Eggerthella lenta]|uniref:hypothetical protein n=1 Tax=Eggerthella lenta TaxID=84112 RepID=UPI00210BE5A4